MWGFAFHIVSQARAQPHQRQEQGPEKERVEARGDGLLSLQPGQLIRKLKGPLCYSTYERNVTWGLGSRYLLSELWWYCCDKGGSGAVGSVWSPLSVCAEWPAGPAARKLWSAGSSEALPNLRLFSYKPQAALQGSGLCGRSPPVCSASCSLPSKLWPS